MNRLIAAITARSVCIFAFLLPRPAAASQLSLEMEAEIAVFSSVSETYLRSCGQSAALSDLSGDEYYTYLLKLRNAGRQPIQGIT